MNAKEAFIDIQTYVKQFEKQENVHVQEAGPEKTQLSAYHVTKRLHGLSALL